MEEHVMKRIVQCKNGLTLVEVMMALVIALVVFLALMQTALVGIDSNMRNILRDEAVSIADTRLNEARNIPFDSLASDTGSLSSCACPATFATTGTCIQRDFKNITNVNYCTNRTVTVLNTDNHQVNVTVGWKWKGEGFTHSVTMILRRQ
jgi:prepilin-type N-terminal cleavage/methylation domain-containing protein